MSIVMISRLKELVLLGLNTLFSPLGNYIKNVFMNKCLSFKIEKLSISEKIFNEWKVVY